MNFFCNVIISFIIFPLVVLSKDTFIIGTLSGNNNNSIVIVNPNSGQIISENLVGSEYFRTLNTAVKDTEKECLLFLDIDYSIRTVSCHSLKEINPFHKHFLSITKWGYSKKTDSIIALHQEEKNEIRKISRTTGKSKILGYLDDFCGVRLGSNCYDSENDKFYISCNNATTNAKKYVVFDVKKDIAKIIDSIEIENDFPEELVVRKNYLYGIQDDKIVKLQIDAKKTERKFVDVISFEEEGLGRVKMKTGTMDNEGLFYYAVFDKYERISYVKFDLTHLKYDVTPIHDNLNNLNTFQKY